MKQLSILLILLLGCFQARTQAVYACTYQQLCNWNAQTEQFDDCNEGQAQNSSFEINKAESVIFQKIQNVNSAFKVKSKEFDRKQGVTIYFVMSDNGNNFYFIFDKKNKEVRVLTKSKGKSSLELFTQTNPWQTN
ncbi:MAG: hypothetical protein IPP32_16270 [Bacteroidetes bacterium]|nr:hypothetical protein [Bacteroidota bacterium]